MPGANMKFTLHDGDLKKQHKFSQIIAVSEKGELTASGKQIDQSLQGQITKLIKKGDFLGKLGATLLLTQSTSQPFEHILLVGSGKSLSITERDYRRLLLASVRSFYATKATSLLSTLTELTVAEFDLAWNIKQAVETTADALYHFDTYKSAKKEAHCLKQIAFAACSDKKLMTTCTKALQQGLAIAEGVNYTKNLANQPSNVCTPTYIAQQAKLLAKEFPAIKVKIVEEAEMQKLGMGAFLSVTKGSAENAKLICLEYKGTPKSKAPIALVGKGITFDTGGLSLKPADSMVGMKYDMCGAATVLGTLKAAAMLKLPLNLVGLLATAENMPSGTASKPEDIVTSMSGQTIEIMNTDAEGRLVLCDTLTYCERYKPEIVIDIATLTGAVVIALGHHATGLLSNNDALASDLLAAGEQSFDRAWQLPLWEEYEEQLKSPFADMSNVGGRAGGTITAACFLSKFAKKFKWAHLDVAGTAAMMGGNDRYATGRPVPLLTQFLINKC
jgi:leucyl aminopeptidase